MHIYINTLEQGAPDRDAWTTSINVKARHSSQTGWCDFGDFTTNSDGNSTITNILPSSAGCGTNLRYVQVKILAFSGEAALRMELVGRRLDYEPLGMSNGFIGARVTVNPKNYQASTIASSSKSETEVAVQEFDYEGWSPVGT